MSAGTGTLTFFHGPMDCGKSTLALQIDHNQSRQGRRGLLLVRRVRSGPARITSGVKLRGNPDNGAPTVGLLKTGDRVQVVQCKGWCEVVVDGKRGFVFKKFLASVSG